MLDFDTWQEILGTIRQNLLRTALTAFSVAWGIFMLVVLLGSGTALGNGAAYQFRDDAMNSIWLWGSITTMPYRGLTPGRLVQLRNADNADVHRGIAQADHVTSRFSIPGAIEVARAGKTGSFDVRSVHPDHLFLERTLIVEGRFLNPSDLAEHRKVAVIGLAVRAALFGAQPPIGEVIEINGIAFKVVGVFDDAGGAGELEKIYLPITTSQRAFSGADRISTLMFTTGDATPAENQLIAAQLRQQVAERHGFDPGDERALRLRDNSETHARVQGMLRGIRAFVWFVGTGTMLAGIVGVSNIMSIVVRERTKEFGIRKALGATPASIVGLVLQEALLVTAVAGWAGLVLGVVALELMRRFLPDSGFFKDPHVDFGTALQAVAILIVAGLLAGFLPARHAASVNPVEALRDE